MAKSQKLTISNIKQMHDKLFTKKKMSFMIEDITFNYLMDERFEVDKIKDYIIDLSTVHQQMYNIKQLFNIDIYEHFLLMKYFTDLDVSAVKSYDDAVKVMKWLDDMECLETIMNAFNQSEVDKINVYMKKAAENKINANPEFQKEYSELLELVSKLIDEKNKKEDEVVDMKELESIIETEIETGENNEGC
jgi:hypothetical protein